MRKVNLKTRGEVEFPVLTGAEFEDCEESFQRLQSYKADKLPLGADMAAVINIAHHALRRACFPDLTRDEVRDSITGRTLGNWLAAVTEAFGLGEVGDSPGEAVSPSNST